MEEGLRESKLLLVQKNGDLREKVRHFVFLYRLFSQTSYRESTSGLCMCVVFRQTYPIYRICFQVFHSSLLEEHLPVLRLKEMLSPSFFFGPSPVPRVDHSLGTSKVLVLNRHPWLRSDTSKLKN